MFRLHKVTVVDFSGSNLSLKLNFPLKTPTQVELGWKVKIIKVKIKL